ncbi:alpha-amylase family glycosyl hydrolase [Polaribacter dokdonensis]|uniref:Alpha-amylase n=1 Tax=Polaribacter dokdonensis DSW-5 TaxID=1300348 RepID=A0A0M9CGP7_9FLAO|nr:alpha-amylase family glycosyl hydrolase [Polaribacter dokdonensis]KOY52271.1 Alpha-amylase [Polaribacter dokdonensis DSW-5]SEE42328.1 Por secretion system C-terminal sorting domain-containing protein [Polaribacter dokdonensis DSW-5]
MKKNIYILFLFISSIGLSQVQNATFAVSPSTFDETDEITITVSNVNPATWGVSDIYLWTWSFDSNFENIADSPTNGSWTNSNEAQKLTNNGNGTYSISFTPTTLYNRTGIGRIGFLVKAKNGDGDKKSQDQLYDVGKFQITLTAPTETTSIIESGTNFQITATTSLAANFNLKANGVSIDQQMNLSSYSFSLIPTENTSFVLEANNNGDIQTKEFNLVVKPTVTEAALPLDIKDGLTINATDNTKATLVLYAPNKEFVHVIGDFNNWEIDNNYLLKKDSSKDRFWIELTGLNPETNHMYQYLVDAKIRIADPYSTQILDPTEDIYIDSTTYPDLPSYPTNATTDAVSFFKTGEAEYVWQTTNFTKPAKTDLVIYELLIRDFDELHSFDAVKARLDYLQGLGINAIEFMPINEFDGNLSWGYNPSFHMAVDKYYGSRTAFKQLVDECHRRGIAVILDVVYNHATGQHPFYRMYNTDNGGTQGQASADSPFFNVVATHSYSVFNDFNHQKQGVKDYVKRTTQYLIEEYKVDGFRWDLTKGFTQNCLGDEGCTNSEQTDRVEILKEYADYQWEIDPEFYIIFEHLGPNSEETKWINYRLNEGKGIMVWGNHHGNYTNATIGENTSGASNFDWISYKNRGWSVPANVSYMESHDEERLTYAAITNGKSNGGYNIKNEETALSRMELSGAFYFTVPGPKMIWQFGELGYDISINQNGRTGNKPILWNYFDDENRKAIYNTWSKLIQLKLKYDIFKTSDFTIDASNSNGLKKIQLSNASASDIQYINVIGNFGITTQNINPVFQQTGTWYDLLDDNATLNVTNTNNLISLAPGEFKVYGNKAAVLSTENIFLDDSVSLYPNPAKDSFSLSIPATKVIIFDVNGKQVKEFKGNFEPNTLFSTNDLEKGLYIVMSQNAEGKILKKLIIN